MPEPEDHSVDLADLKEGDAVLVFFEDTLFVSQPGARALHVSRISPPGALGRSVLAGPLVQVGFGPGRWNVGIDYSHIDMGSIRIERA